MLLPDCDHPQFALSRSRKILNLRRGQQAQRKNGGEVALAGEQKFNFRSTHVKDSRAACV